MSGVENTLEAVLPCEEAAPVKEAPKAPESTATGNGKITILKHAPSVADRGEEYPIPAGIDLAIRNVSDRDIATVVFEAIFYDREGKIVDTVKHREVELKLDTSRAIRVNSSIPFFESHKVKSYDVRVVRTTTADVERVQIRRHEVTTTEAGEEEISGIVKNISDVKTDAAVVWTFYDPKKENIGTKVVILRDMEPNAIRQYGFRFKPQEGDTVRSYNIIVGEIAG